MTDLVVKKTAAKAMLLGVIALAANGQQALAGFNVTFGPATVQLGSGYSDRDPNTANVHDRIGLNDNQLAVDVDFDFEDSVPNDPNDPNGPEDTLTPTTDIIGKVLNVTTGGPISLGQVGEFRYNEGSINLAEYNMTPAQLGVNFGLTLSAPPTVSSEVSSTGSGSGTFQGLGGYHNSANSLGDAGALDFRFTLTNNQISFQLFNNGTLTITLHNQLGGNVWDFFTTVENTPGAQSGTQGVYATAVYTSVPEPASLSLLGCGIIGIGAWRRGKRRAQKNPDFEG